LEWERAFSDSINLQNLSRINFHLPERNPRAANICLKHGLNTKKKNLLRIHLFLPDYELFYACKGAFVLEGKFR
jgi:hypothetical protein